MKLLNKLKCLFGGHVKWNSGDEWITRFFQNSKVGNNTVQLHFCDRCESFYGIVAPMTPQELLQEELAMQQLIAREEAIARIAAQMKSKLPNISSDGINFVKKTDVN